MFISQDNYKQIHPSLIINNFLKYLHKSNHKIQFIYFSLM